MQDGGHGDRGLAHKGRPPGSRRRGRKMARRRLSLPLMPPLLLLLLLLLVGRGGCTELTYGDPEDKKLYEEENQASDCGNGYYDRMALLCWPKFHASIMATAEDSRCLWETVGSMYSELTLCAGLLAESMACPMSSPTLDAFFVSIHTEYFAGCALHINATVHPLPTGTIIALAALPVCLVPLSVALTLRRA